MGPETNRRNRVHNVQWKATEFNSYAHLCYIDSTHVLSQYAETVLNAQLHICTVVSCRQARGGADVRGIVQFRALQLLKFHPDTWRRFDHIAILLPLRLKDARSILSTKCYYTHTCIRERTPSISSAIITILYYYYHIITTACNNINESTKVKQSIWDRTCTEFEEPRIEC